MLTIQNIPISQIKSGTLKALADFDDYGIKAGHEYKVHFASGVGAYIFADGEIQLWDNELRQDVCDKLIWIADKD